MHGLYLSIPKCFFSVSLCGCPVPVCVISISLFYFSKLLVFHTFLFFIPVCVALQVGFMCVCFLLLPVRSQSPSDGSEGTGDELLVRRKPRSFKKKCRSPTMESSTCIVSPPLSDSDNVGSPPRKYD